MTTHRCKSRQTVIDVAISECGSVEAGFDISGINDISITDDVSGVVVKLPDVVDKRVVSFYKHNTAPATEVL
ncbi:MAG: hypothetical protein PHR20_02245 [Bacteroidales bacterium]|nr:hypothetical protein [Bacteroidales bacterium]